jgi:hypothetical protein
MLSLLDGGTVIDIPAAETRMVPEATAVPVVVDVKRAGMCACKREVWKEFGCG